MMNWIKRASVAAVAVAGLAMGSSAFAGSMQLGNSGWTASWDSSSDATLNLAVDFESQDTIYLEKFATFTPSSVNPGGFIDPVVITFQQNSSNAAKFLVLNDETVVNQTGLSWDGFRFTILGGNTGTDQDVRFNPAQSNVGGSGGFSVTPFSTADFSSNDQILTLGGGTVPSSPPAGPNVWFPGVASGGLVINAPQTAGNLVAFTLKETPLPGGGHVIPLPAAAWSGLTGLLGLALLGGIKHSKRLFS